MKNMKLALTIGVGFGLVIAIAVALGAVAVLAMNGVQGDARRLSQETVPQVAVANNVERNALETMYTMRGFSLSDNGASYDKAKSSLDSVKMYLADAQALAQQTAAVTAEVTAARGEQDTSAAAFMAACFDYLARNTADMKSAISRKASAGVQAGLLGEISTINDVIDTGNALRVANFKAQAERDSTILKTLTTDKADLAAFATIQAAGEAYRAAAQTILDNG